MSTDKNLRLDMEIVHIKDIRFGAKTEVRSGILFINKQEMVEAIADPFFSSIDIDLARPGESVRIIPVKDVVEPRVKLDGKGAGSSFPGFAGAYEGCGEGRLKVFKGCAIVTTGTIVGVQEGVIDMKGTCADYCYYSKLNNIVVVGNCPDGTEPHAHEAACRLLGLHAANYLTDSLKELGIEMFRFKTGTPARIAGNTIDYSKMEEQFGDERVVPFSFSTNPEDVQIEQKSCWLTYTNEKTHEIIRANLDRSPLYSGMIEGTGPRYCPSIEDKVVRFADKNRHQVFIEPEGLYTNEMYIGGMSSSLPEDVQEEMYHSVPGLEHAKIVKNAYAIEYDCINPRQLYPTLEFKKIKGLFSGGQFNGSSGYEEAAAQGLIAGINAAMEVKGQEQLILDRSEAYIGVLIDDLVTKENHEPYRMMTSRAEYRLLLRQDNADLRLRKKGYQVGLISEEEYQKILAKEEQIKKEIERVEHTNIGANKEVQALLESYNSTPLKSGTTLAELIRRPELSYEAIKPLDKERSELPWDVQEQVDINIKYDGYIRRQLKQVEQFKKLEAKKIPADLDYEKVGSLRIEARQKLEAYRPISIGQASRISGVSPADISVLLVYLSSAR